MITTVEQKKFEKMIERAEEMMKEVELEIPEGIEYRINKRFTRTMGRCTVRNNREDIKIEIAEFYLKGNMVDGNDTAIISTILHEICHALPGAYNHGDMWKAYVGILNREFGLNIQRLGRASMSCKEMRYAGKDTVKIGCKDGCFEDIVLSNSKRNQSLERYICSTCKSRLIRIVE